MPVCNRVASGAPVLMSARGYRVERLGLETLLTPRHPDQPRATLELLALQGRADSATINARLHTTVLARIAENGGNVPKELLD